MVCTVPAVADTSGRPQAAITSWPWWVWPLRPAPKREAAPPKVCAPRTGNTPAPAPGAHRRGSLHGQPPPRRTAAALARGEVPGHRPGRHAHAEASEALVADAGAQVVGPAAASVQDGVAHRPQPQAADQHQAAAPDLAARRALAQAASTGRSPAPARSSAPARARPCRRACPARSHPTRPPTAPSPAPSSTTSGPPARAGRGCRRGRRGRRPCRRCPARCPTPAAGCRRAAGRRRTTRCTRPSGCGARRRARADPWPAGRGTTTRVVANARHMAEPTG